MRKLWCSISIVGCDIIGKSQGSSGSKHFDEWWKDCASEEKEKISSNQTIAGSQ